MAKRRSNKLTGTNAAKAWNLMLEGVDNRTIAREIGYTTYRVKMYRSRKFKLEADKLWAAKVKAGGKCVIPGCNRADLNAHHLISKGSFPHLRYELLNGLCLCSWHHMRDPHISGHSGTVAADNLMSWLWENKKNQYRWVRTHKDDKAFQQVDYEMEYWGLKND